MITKKDIIGHDHDVIVVELGPDLIAKVRCKFDRDHGLPWKEEEGHGPVSEWVTRDKGPGERVLCEDRRSKLYYDFAAAMKMAKRDGWGISEERKAALEKQEGVILTKAGIAALAVEADFDLLRRWCNNDWQYIVLYVTLHNAAGSQLDIDTVGGMSNDGDYWKEEAADMINTLHEKHLKEQAEITYWNEREIVTVP